MNSLCKLCLYTKLQKKSDLNQSMEQMTWATERSCQNWLSELANSMYKVNNVQIVTSLTEWRLDVIMKTVIYNCLHKTPYSDPCQIVNQLVIAHHPYYVLMKFKFEYDKVIDSHHMQLQGDVVEDEFKNLCVVFFLKTNRKSGKSHWKVREFFRVDCWQPWSLMSWCKCIIS